MADPVAVPDVVGKAFSDAQKAVEDAGLKVGTLTKASSPTVPSGNVISSNPLAGSSVTAGSAVNLQVSTGPAGDVAVPDVTGLTKQAAEAVLKNAGLGLGPVTNHSSDSVPKGGVIGTIPDAGTTVSSGSKVGLSISSGPATNFWQYLPNVLFTVLGLVVLGVIIYGVTQPSGVFLNNLGKKEVARGLITFLIAISTVGIAIILSISTLLLPAGDDGDKRFDRGKQVLTVLIGVLGTIVGFYFGSSTDTHSNPAITTAALPDGAANQAYNFTLQATGGTQPLKWSVTPELPSPLKLDAATGAITGTPTAALPQTKFTFTVIDSSSPPLSSPPTVLTLEIK
ncbi:MAG TPA: PASTA domain-containing protein [Bryobacteraceae bacterium]|nr:PASTA domain-containing protein [Bryobacteraceae bacterium]